MLCFRSLMRAVLCIMSRFKRQDMKCINTRKEQQPSGKKDEVKIHKEIRNIEVKRAKRRKETSLSSLNHHSALKTRHKARKNMKKILHEKSFLNMHFLYYQGERDLNIYEGGKETHAKQKESSNSFSLSTKFGRTKEENIHRNVY